MPFRYPLDEQQGDKLCWAAVALSVDKYFDPGSSNTQCSVAGAVLGRGCCPDPEVGCNEVEFLEKALDKVNRLASWPTAGPLSFTEIKDSINQRIPICVRIEWRGGGEGHFVVICGYRETKEHRQFVEVLDPWFPNSIVSYHEFVETYQNAERADAGGFWSHTYRVRN